MVTTNGMMMMIEAGVGRRYTFDVWTINRKRSQEAKVGSDYIKQKSTK